MGLLSPFLRKSRYAQVLPYVRGDVLDLGCQQGQLLGWPGLPITSYVGIDFSAENLDRARGLYPQGEFHQLDLDAEPLDFQNRFDTIVLVAVIEHIFNLGMLGGGLARALKPGGSILLTTPTPFGNDIVHRLGAQLGLFARSAADDHIAIFNRKRLDIFAREFGLRLAQYRRFQVGCNQFAVLQKPADKT